MRILLTADPEVEVPPVHYGGIQRIVDSLAAELRTRGHKVGLVARPGSECKVDRIFFWKGLRSQSLVDTIQNMSVLRSAVKDFAPDIIHSFSRMLYLMPVLRSRIPKVMSYQRDPGVRQVSRVVSAARGTLHFTGCSEYISNRGRKGGGSWTTVHNFVDLSKFTYREGVPADAPLVFLSRVERIKGAHATIELAKRTGRKLLIAGNHSEAGEEGRYWQSEILPHLDGQAIEYIGPVNDSQKNALLGRAAALVVPIEWEEPFGIVFAEALACGTPVISAPRGALPEIVRSGSEGFLVKDLEEGVSAISRVSQISRADCRRRAEECFSSQIIVPQYEALYRSLSK